MFRKVMIAAAMAALLVSCTAADDSAGGSTAPPPPEPIDASAALTEATSAMGAEGLDSITYSGTAWTIRNGWLQTPTASPPWESRNEITNYTRTIDFTQAASRATGETFAQNMFFAPATEGAYTQNIAADAGWGQQLEIWLTPWGFLEGAEANAATAVSQMIDGTEYSVVSWMAPQTAPSGLNYTVTGYINADGLVERVETWVEDSLAGDLHVENVYSGYQDFDGVMVPTTMEQLRAGGGVFGVTVTTASANPANVAELVTPPAPPGGGRGGRGGAPGGGQAAAPTDLAQDMGGGVWLITGGYQSLAVEFEDHIAVFEGGQSEDRGEQIIAEVHRVIPDKPIRYVVNSHPHSDHLGGIVPFIREGATIVTHENNVAFLNLILSTPRTLLGEETLDPQFEGVGDMLVLEDGMNRLELHSVPNGHTDGMLVGLHPGQSVLIQADFTLPTGGAEPNPFVVTLAERVSELGLEFDQYHGVHAAQAPQTRADLMAAIGQ